MTTYEAIKTWFENQRDSDIMCPNKWIRKMFYSVEIFPRYKKKFLHINKEIKTK